MFFVSFCGLIVVVISFYIINHLDSSEQWIAIVFRIIGFLIIIFSAFSIIKLNKRIKLYDQKQKNLIEHAKNEKDEPGHVVDLWKYKESEKTNFLRNEKRRKIKELTIIGLMIVALGVPLLIFARDASILSAFVVSSILALIYGIVSYSINLKRYSNNESELFQILFFKDSLLINNRLQILKDDKINLENVEIVSSNNSEQLHFIIFWYNSKNNKITDDIFIPVPSTYHENAVRMVAFYKEQLSG